MLSQVIYLRSAQNSEESSAGACSFCEFHAHRRLSDRMLASHWPSHWTSRNYCTVLSLNFSKSCYMIINKQPYTPCKFDLDLSLRSFSLKRERTVRYLGLYIDDCLKWSSHVNHLSLQLARYAGILYKIRDFVPQKTLCMLYNSLIYSRIQYGILIWGTAAKM